MVNWRNRKGLILGIISISFLALLLSSQFFAIAPLPSSITLTIQPKGMIGILKPTLTVTAKSSSSTYAISGVSAKIIGNNGWESALYTAKIVSGQYEINTEVTLPQIQSYTISVSIRWYDGTKPPGDNQFTHVKEEGFTVNPEGEETVVSGTTVPVTTVPTGPTIPQLDLPFGELPVSIDSIIILIGLISLGVVMRYKRKNNGRD